MTLFRAWLDVRVLRDAGGRITGLHVDGGRATEPACSRASIDNSRRDDELMIAIRARNTTR